MNRKSFKTFAVISGAVLAGTVAATEPGLAHARPFHRIHRQRWLVLPPAGPAPVEIPPPGTPYFAPVMPAPASPTPPPSTAMPPLPGGMMITVTKILRDKSETVSPSRSQDIALPKQAAQYLANCWSPPLPPPGDTVEVTLRFGFNRSGAVLWPPRITYVKLGPGMTGADVRASILDAFKACTPLHLSPAMAANIPGEPISVRFIGRREDEAGAQH